MLAFLGPVQMMFLLVVLLIIFGPQNLPEIGQQIGRALRELKRAGQDLQNSINLDDDPPRYDPPRYNDYNYGSDYNSGSSYSGWSDTQNEGPTPLPKPEPPRGDAAASALSDLDTEFNFGTPEGSVPRSKSWAFWKGDKTMLNTLAFWNNPTALIIIAVVILFLFGGKKIPEMMRGLGSGMKEFKEGMKETEDDELRREREKEEQREREIRARVEEEMRREKDKMLK
jgi:sec-independent protein translocase protein TatA